MSIDIDFTMAPPTLADISEKREQVVSERAVYKKKNIRFMTTMVFIVVAYVTLMIVTVIPMIGKAEPDWAMMFYFLPYLTFVIFIVGNDIHIKKIEKPSKLLDKSIAELTAGPVDEINTIINDKKQAGEIVSYLDQVAAQGRSLVCAEIDAIKKWHDTKSLANSPGKRSRLGPCI